MLMALWLSSQKNILIFFQKMIHPNNIVRIHFRKLRKLGKSSIIDFIIKVDEESIVHL